VWRSTRAPAIGVLTTEDLMSYEVDGTQFIVIAVSSNDGAELLACALP
jgi:hypothetical protein